MANTFKVITKAGVTSADVIYTVAGSTTTIILGLIIGNTTSGTITIDSQASTTTIDGHTGVTVQSTNSGDITLDSVADIVLDAGGADIKLKDGGTQFGNLKNNSGELRITSSSSDTTAITMTGANVAVAGTLTVGGAALVDVGLVIALG